MTKIKKKFLEEPEAVRLKGKAEDAEKEAAKEKPPEKPRRWKKKKFDIPKDEIPKEPMTKEQKLYYMKMVLGFVTGWLGRTIGLIGWWLLLWLVIFWFAVPLPLGLLLGKYEKGKWDWKVFIKTAVGMFFFIFMLTAIITHTLIATSNPNFVPPRKP